MAGVYRSAAIVLSACALASIPAATHAVTAERPAASGFVSFSEFIHATAWASYPSYTAAGRNGGVRSSTAFAQMRSYILNLYHGVQVRHSFMLDGRYVDCVTISSQPSARGQRIGKIPRPLPLGGAAQAGGQGADSPLTLGLRDAYGNAVSCPNGTVPMARVSLSETTAFPSMAAYLDFKPAADVPHRYAYGGEKVKNLGAGSKLSIWSPKGYFSLSQVWITAGSGDALQTVEAGWVTCSGCFKNKPSDAVPFVFFTTDDYRSHKDCYDLNCKDTFKQLDKNFMLGMPFAHYSTVGGKQYYLSLGWYFTDSRWYLYAGGKAVGYYPASLFGKDGAMSKHGDIIDFGGETFTNSDTWPPMGSGKFAAAGPGKAASQSEIYYDTYPFPTGHVAELSRSVLPPDSKCYTVTGADNTGPAPGNTYIYFGGPGGKC